MKNEKGIIFNIQKFSLHDGPGIRTVVFLKGCPLRCPWCSNPESQNDSVQITWDAQKCSHCHKCIDICPTSAISAVTCMEKEIIIIDEELCIQCMKCTKSCPTEALSYEGYHTSVEEVMIEVLKDKVFYDESGGGMTLSGGEALQQVEFATLLLKTAREHGIHTAAETTCYTDIDTFKGFIEHLDLLLCDIKHYDNDKHLNVIGGALEPIKRNIKYAISTGLECIGRIPVIPDYNFSHDDAVAFCDYLDELGIEKVSLLPYHNYGENKYKLLNKPYLMSQYESIDKNNSDFVKFKQVFIDKDFTIVD